MTALRYLAVSVVLLVFGTNCALGAEPGKDKPIPEVVSYYKDVRPIFALNCQGCHQPAKPLGGLAMTGYAEILKGGESQEAGFIPGKPDDSLLLKQITSQGGQPPAMPKEKPPLLKTFGVHMKDATSWVLGLTASIHMIVRQGHEPTTPPLRTPPRRKWGFWE